VFVIEARQAAARGHGTAGIYFCHDNAAIAAAKKKQEKDGNERRVNDLARPA